MAAWALWAVCLGLLLLRGLYGAAESALYATSDIRARELCDQHPRRGKRVLKLKMEREATAAALRFGGVLTGFTAAAIGALVPPHLFDLELSRLGDHPALAVVAPLASALMVAVAAALFDVAFRAAAAQKPEGWALVLSGYVQLSVGVLYPVMRVLIAPVNVVLALVRHQGDLRGAASAAGGAGEAAHRPGAAPGAGQGRAAADPLHLRAVGQDAAAT